MKILEQISIDRSGCSGFDCNQLKYRVHVLSRILGGERFIEGNTDDHTGERAKKKWHLLQGEKVWRADSAT